MAWEESHHRGIEIHRETEENKIRPLIDTLMTRFGYVDSRVGSLGQINVTVPGSRWWIRQERTTCSHVDLVAPVIMPEDLCSFVQQTFTGHGPIQEPPVLQPDIVFVNAPGGQLSFKIVAGTRSAITVFLKVRSHVKQLPGHGISQRQIHCRPVRMRRPVAGIVFVEGRLIYDELSCTFPVFLVAATWALLFRFCVVEVPQSLLAANRTMTVEHEQLGVVRPKQLVDAAELFGHRFSQPDILSA